MVQISNVVLVDESDIWGETHQHRLCSKDQIKFVDVRERANRARRALGSRAKVRAGALCDGCVRERGPTMAHACHGARVSGCRRAVAPACQRSAAHTRAYARTKSSGRKAHTVCTTKSTFPVISIHKHTHTHGVGLIRTRTRTRTRNVR
eukprot:6211247-Pleurochrysis_carterae.AAC.1